MKNLFYLFVVFVVASASGQTLKEYNFTEPKTAALTQPPDYYINLRYKFFAGYTPATANSAAWWTISGFVKSGNFVWTNNNTETNIQGLSSSSVEVLSSSGVRQGENGVFLANGLVIPPGTYQLKGRFTISGVDGFLNSQITLEEKPAQPKKATVDLVNPTEIPVTYKFYEGSSATPFKTVNLAPGQSQTVYLETNSGEDVQVWGEATGVLDEDGNLAPGSQFLIWKAGHITNSVMANSPTGSEPSPRLVINNLPTVPGNIRNQLAGPTANEGKPVFNSGGGDGTGLDKGTFILGVNGLKSGLDEINRTLKANAAAGGGETGGGGDFTATNALLTSTNTKLDALIGTGTEQGVTAPSGELTQFNSATLLPKITGLVPALPEIVLPSTVTSFSTSIQFPGMASPTVIETDLEDYSAGITVFRTIVLGVITLMAFFVMVRTIKGAFA
jgi:hypothetical protein